MTYVRFNGDDSTYPASVMPCTTQHGKDAVRIVASPIPVHETGFRLFDENGKVIANYSSYRHHYEDNTYSVEPDEINHAGPGNAPIPVSPLYSLERQVAAVTVQVNETASQVDIITPYTAEKQVYIDETEAVFDVPRLGAISAWLESDGVTVPCVYTVEEGRVTLTFEPLEAVGMAHISIQ